MKIKELICRKTCFVIYVFKLILQPFFLLKYAISLALKSQQPVFPLVISWMDAQWLSLKTRRESSE